MLQDTPGLLPLAQLPVATAVMLICETDRSEDIHARSGNSSGQAVYIHHRKQARGQGSEQRRGIVTDNSEPKQDIAVYQLSGTLLNQGSRQKGPF